MTQLNPPDKESFQVLNNLGYSVEIKIYFNFAFSPQPFRTPLIKVPSKYYTSTVPVSRFEEDFTIQISNWPAPKFDNHQIDGENYAFEPLNHTSLTRSKRLHEAEDSGEVLQEAKNYIPKISDDDQFFLEQNESTDNPDFEPTTTILDEDFDTTTIIVHEDYDYVTENDAKINKNVDLASNDPIQPRKAEDQVEVPIKSKLQNEILSKG